MHKLIGLPYKDNALEPVVSAETISFHYGKHLKAYVDNLNKLIEGSRYESMHLEDIVKDSSGGIFNNSGQILNHNLYFEQFQPVQLENSAQEAVASPVSDGNIKAASPSLSKQIETQWGSLEAFMEEFTAKGVSLFGSGWVWLSSAEKESGGDLGKGTLVITQEPGAGNPITKGLKPILTFDVWEHAYYLDYQNARASHLKALWSIINWEVLEKRYRRQDNR